MEYKKNITLKNSKSCCLRNGTKEDGETLFDLFIKTHEETDFLRSYPEENTLTIKDEAEFLEEKRASENEVEILAEVDGKIVGTAGIEAVGTKYKEKHRADFGISVLKEYWGQGIGNELLKACITCAKQAGFKQLELNVVADNEVAIALYKKHGFEEFGRNQKGFCSKFSGYQELVYMCKDLEI